MISVHTVINVNLCICGGRGKVLGSGLCRIRRDSYSFIVGGGRPDAERRSQVPAQPVFAAIAPAIRQIYKPIPLKKLQTKLDFIVNSCFLSSQSSSYS